MRFFTIILFIITLAFFVVQTSNAQDISFGVATYVPISQDNVKNGSIVSTTNKGFELSSRAYDPLIFGVVSQNPAVSFGGQVQEKTYPIISSGQAYVLVNGENGAIKSGDLITASTALGVGMKASKSGFVVGSALADFTPKTATEQQVIPLSLNLHFFTTKSSLPSKLSDLFNFSLIAATDEPLTVFKYVVALFIIVLSFVLGLVSFGKIATNGIEALGRNPLASKMIELGIAFNVIITISIIAAGIVMALFIIRL